MKKTPLLLLLLFCTMQLFGQQDSLSGIQFRSISFDEAIKASARENKPVFMHGYASWCHYCEYMKDSVYPKKEVGDFYNANFINIKLDLEKEGADLNKKLMSHTFPTLVFFSSDGEVLHRAVGRYYTSMFLQLGQEALDPRRQLRTWKNLYNNGMCSADTAYRYLRKVEVAGMDVQPEALKYLTRLKPDELKAPENWKIINELYKDVNAPFMQTLIRIKPDLESSYTKNVVNNKFYDIYNFEFYMRVRQLDTAGYEKLQQKIKASGLDLAPMICDFADLNRAKAKSEYDTYYKLAEPIVAKYCANDAIRLQEIIRVYFEHTKDTALLNKATVWSRHTVELADTYLNNETLVGLLIMTGNKKEATDVANHAVELAKKGSINYKKVLLYMEKIEEMKD